MLKLTAATFDHLFASVNSTGGSVSIVYRDRLLMSHGYGYTMINGAGRPVDGDTLFAVGSISKLFTIADALRQQEVCWGKKAFLFFFKPRFLPVHPGC